VGGGSGESWRGFDGVAEMHGTVGSGQRRGGENGGERVGGCGIGSGHRVRGAGGQLMGIEIGDRDGRGRDDWQFGNRSVKGDGLQVVQGVKERLKSLFSRLVVLLPLKVASVFSFLGEDPPSSPLRTRSDRDDVRRSPAGSSTPRRSGRGDLKSHSLGGGRGGDGDVVGG
jgi:hypothetical protein